MYAIRHGRLERVPDLVVYPSTEEQVTAIVNAAARHDVCLVPYGEGTNVTDALRCPVDEERSIVSVDLSRLDRILWIDPVNMMACIQAGAVAGSRPSWPAMVSRWDTNPTASSSPPWAGGSRPTPAG